MLNMDTAMKTYAGRWLVAASVVALAFSTPLMVSAFVSSTGFPMGAAQMTPGSTASGTITIDNTSDGTLPAGIESTSTADPDELGKQMTLVIEDADEEFFNGDFWDFLTGGPVPLGDIAGNDDNTYTFTLTMKADAPESFQGKTLGFDLCVGFLGGDVQCGDTIVGPEGPGGSGGGSGGGGGGGGSSKLVISNEGVTNLSSGIAPESGIAIIEWDTNLLATSQVIYGLASGGPYILDIDASPCMGYAECSVEDSTKKTHHIVVLSGLTPGAEYVYRVVSRASPATVSSEHAFIIDITSADDQPFIGGVGGSGIALGGPSDGVFAAGNNTDAVDETATGTGADEGLDITRTQTAAAIDGLPEGLFSLFQGECDCVLPLLTTLIAIVYGGSMIAYFYFHRGNAQARSFFIRNTMFAAGFAIGLYILWAADILCSVWMLGAVLLIAWAVYDYRVHQRAALFVSALPRIGFFCAALLLALVVSLFMGIACLVVPFFLLLVGCAVWLTATLRR